LKDLPVLHLLPDVVQGLGLQVADLVFVIKGVLCEICTFVGGSVSHIDALVFKLDNTELVKDFDLDEIRLNGQSKEASESHI